MLGRHRICGKAALYNISQYLMLRASKQKSAANRRMLCVVGAQSTTCDRRVGSYGVDVCVHAGKAFWEVTF